MNLIDKQDHHDGFKLNDSIRIYCDERDAENGGNASHTYTAVMPAEELGGQVLFARFQHGPRDEEGSTPGITDAVLVTILLDRYRGFQSGPYSCRENAIVITKLDEALLWMKKRAFDRAARGVLGKNEV